MLLLPNSVFFASVSLASSECVLLPAAEVVGRRFVVALRLLAAFSSSLFPEEMECVEDARPGASGPVASGLLVILMRASGVRRFWCDAEVPPRVWFDGCIECLQDNAGQISFASHRKGFA